MFTPALHRQRHQFVVDYVEREKPKKVVDLGCGECSLLRKLKFHREIELLVGVDINGDKVKKKMHELSPLPTDYLQPSYDQLRVELYQGSITQRDSRLTGFDLVTSIELIEHLTPADVERFSSVLFGYMCPVAVIVSTPNAEFNPLLPGLKGFRHSDHKFEWTRAEFRSWALKVCCEYGYEVEFTGVGRAPLGQQERVGFCSQIGVFHRLRRSDGCNVPPDPEAEETVSYTQLFSINYPSLHDNNILQRLLLSELLYFVEKLKSEWTDDETSSSDGASTLCLAETGVPRETQQTVANECCSARLASACLLPSACGEDVKNQVKCCGTVVSTEEDEFVLLPIKQKQHWKQHRCVSVPLQLLWSCCPKVRTLSGSLNSLRHLLMDLPQVTLSQDSSAVIVTFPQQDQDEEEMKDESEDNMWAGQLSHVAEQEEDWEPSV